MALSVVPEDPFYRTLLMLVAVLMFAYLITWAADERKIRRLGGHAPSINSYVPFDIPCLDLAYYAIVATTNHANIPLWERFFGKGALIPPHNYTVEAKIGLLRCVFTSEPENIKAMLATQFGDYPKGESFHDDFRAFLGDGIFVTDGESWHQSRQLLRTQFIKTRVSDLDVFEEHGQILMNAIANGGIGVPGDGIARGKEIDVSDLFFRYTLDSATHFLFGKSVESLYTQDQEFSNAFTEVQRVQNIISRAGPLKHFVPRRSFNAGLKVLNDFANPIIDQALQLSPEELTSKEKSHSGYTFLHAIAGHTRDRKVLRDQVVTVLLAGRDTTASTLSWTFYELARHPEVVKRLREEIIEVVGLNKPPTYEDLKAMKYLQYTMNETLRIYPVVPFNVRTSQHDTTLPRGGGPDGLSPIGILKGTQVGFSTINMQRRADLYPPTHPSDPLHHKNFNPDRWFSWKPKPWTYIPFNGGPRICIGQQFALTNAGYTIVRLLQRFERIDNFMEKVDGGHPRLKAEIVLQPGQGVRVGFWEAR